MASVLQGRCFREGYILVGRLNSPPPRCPHPDPCNLRICDLKWQRDFTDVIKFRTWRQGDYPGLSGWALNIIITDLMRERQEASWGEDDVMTEAEIGVLRPGAQKCQRPLEAGRDRKLPEGISPSDTECSPLTLTSGS